MASNEQSPARPLPLEIEEITRDWLTAALRTQAPEATVEHFEIVDILNGTCTKIRLRLQLNAAGRAAGIPELVILKGGFEPHSRDLAITHENEVYGYRDVMPVLGLHSPACYFADFCAEQKQGIVIIDDLVARGVTFCHPLQPQSFDQVARRLRALARFHAGSWDSPEIREGGRWAGIKEVMPPLRALLEPYLQPETWARFTGAPQGVASSVRFLDSAWIREAVEQMGVLYYRLPRCVVHGDTHLGNLYIERDGTPGFFDHQPMRAPAALEVAYHLTGALDLADRPRWEGALLATYLSELRASGVDAPSLDEFCRQVGAFLLLGHIIFLINESHYQPEAINTAYAARFNAAMLAHDTPRLLREFAAS